MIQFVFKLCLVELCKLKTLLKSHIGKTDEKPNKNV